MPSRTHEPTTPMFPAEDERTLPGPARGPSAAVTGSIVFMALLMLIGGVLLG